MCKNVSHVQTHTSYRQENWAWNHRHDDGYIRNPYLAATILWIHGYIFASDQHTPQQGFVSLFSHILIITSSTSKCLIETSRSVCDILHLQIICWDFRDSLKCQDMILLQCICFEVIKLFKCPTLGIFGSDIPEGGNSRGHLPCGCGSMKISSAELYVLHRKL